MTAMAELADLAVGGDRVETPGARSPAVE